MKDNIEIRFATEEDRLKVIDLWKYAFSDTDEFLDYYFERRYAPENTVVLLRDKSLEAALQLNPYNLAMGDMISQVSYVVGVSVQPESRGKGFMNKLMKAPVGVQAIMLSFSTVLNYISMMIQKKAFSLLTK